jgi:hypothetical protein
MRDAIGVLRRVSERDEPLTRMAEDCDAIELEFAAEPVEIVRNRVESRRADVAKVRATSAEFREHELKMSPELRGERSHAEKRAAGARNHARYSAAIDYVVNLQSSSLLGATRPAPQQNR